MEEPSLWRRDVYPNAEQGDEIERIQRLRYIGSEGAWTYTLGVEYHGLSVAMTASMPFSDETNPPQRREPEYLVGPTQPVEGILESWCLRCAGEESDGEEMRDNCR